MTTTAFPIPDDAAYRYPRPEAAPELEPEPPHAPPQATPPPPGYDADTILPEPDQVRLKSGTVVQVRPLKLLEMLLFFRIFTSGLGTKTASEVFAFEADTSNEEVIARVLFKLCLALPDAGPQGVAFLRAMVEPAGTLHGLNLSKPDRARQREASDALDVELANPEIEDAAVILDKIIRQAAPTMEALGKLFRGLMPPAMRAGLTRNFRQSTA